MAMLAEQMMGKEHITKIPGSVNSHLSECEVCESAVFDLYSDISNQRAVMFAIKLPKKDLPPSVQRFVRIRSIIRFSAVAAILVLMVVIGRGVSFSPPDSDELFNTYFSPYQNLVTIKGDGENKLSKAMLYYDVKDYDSAIILFKTILADDSGQLEKVFYLGNALLAVAEADSAIVYFKKSLAGQDRFADAAQWYLALAYVKNDELANAEVLLKEIVAMENFWSAKAEKLLGEIR